MQQADLEQPAKEITDVYLANSSPKHNIDRWNAIYAPFVVLKDRDVPNDPGCRSTEPPTAQQCQLLKEEILA